MKYNKTDINQPYLEILKCCGMNGEMKQPVKALWYRGQLPEQRVPTVAIVGARRCTLYGEEQAYRAAYELAKRGIIIISGLAYGIDTCAHRGCLDAGGTTIAVLGTGIDQIHPRSNERLAERILERGAIISEYPPEFETKAYCFQERNRIVSGLADAVLIIEASRQSGTYGTYNNALKQGKDVFVLPGDVTRPMSAGANDMLRQGAHPYIEPIDILTKFGMPSRSCFGPQLNVVSPLARKVYAAISVDYRHPDEIIAALGISAVDFNIAISELELNDLIVLRGGNWAIK